MPLSGASASDFTQYDNNAHVGISQMRTIDQTAKEEVYTVIINKNSGKISSISATF